MDDGTMKKRAAMQQPAPFIKDRTTEQTYGT
jgi:hypothetical protein